MIRLIVNIGETEDHLNLEMAHWWQICFIFIVTILRCLPIKLYICKIGVMTLFYILKPTNLESSFEMWFKFTGIPKYIFHHLTSWKWSVFSLQNHFSHLKMLSCIAYHVTISELISSAQFWSPTMCSLQCINEKRFNYL